MAINQSKLRLRKHCIIIDFKLRIPGGAIVITIYNEMSGVQKYVTTVQKSVTCNTAKICTIVQNSVTTEKPIKFFDGKTGMQILLTNQINMAGEVDERMRSSTRIYEEVTGVNLKFLKENVKSAIAM